MCFLVYMYFDCCTLTRSWINRDINVQTRTLTSSLIEYSESDEFKRLHSRSKASIEVKQYSDLKK